LEKNIETLELCPDHCYSPNPVGPPAKSHLHPSAKATATCTRNVADELPTAVAPMGPPPPQVSRHPWFHRPTTCVVHHLALSTAASRSQAVFLLFMLPTALLYHPRAHSTRHRQPLATTDERRLKHHHPRAPSDSSDRAFVHPRATSPCPEDCRGRQSSASFIHRHLAVDSCLWPSFGPPNSSSRTPALP
jgi:hypothetical protein